MTALPRGPEELAALADAIQRGETPHFDQAELARVTSIVQSDRGLPWGCNVAVWVPIVLLVLLALVVVSLYRAGAYP